MMWMGVWGYISFFAFVVWVGSYVAPVILHAAGMKTDKAERIFLWATLQAAFLWFLSITCMVGFVVFQSLVH